MPERRERIDVTMIRIDQRILEFIRGKWIEHVQEACQNRQQSSFVIALSTSEL